jgi:hypothetical protein
MGARRARGGDAKAGYWHRQTWIEANYGGDSEIPKLWTAEDEAEVPAPCRRQL